MFLRSCKTHLTATCHFFSIIFLLCLFLACTITSGFATPILLSSCCVIWSPLFCCRHIPSTWSHIRSWSQMSHLMTEWREENWGREGSSHSIISLTACTKKVLIYTMYKNHVVSIRRVYFFLALFLTVICWFVSWCHVTVSPCHRLIFIESALMSDLYLQTLMRRINAWSCLTVVEKNLHKVFSDKLERIKCSEQTQPFNVDPFSKVPATGRTDVAIAEVVLPWHASVELQGCHTMVCATHFLQMVIWRFDQPVRFDRSVKPPSVRSPLQVWESMKAPSSSHLHGLTDLTLVLLVLSAESWPTCQSWQVGHASVTPPDKTRHTYYRETLLKI